MIYHASIGVRNPERVAKAIARLWGGEAVPFLGVRNGSWMALAGDDRGSAIEVYFSGIVLDPSEEGSVGLQPVELGSELTSTHLAIGTDLTEEEVISLGEEEGWFTRKKDRHLPFGVIEIWVEDHILFEVLTAEMRADYVRATSIDGWHAYLEQEKGGEAETTWKAASETHRERIAAKHAPA